MSNMHFLLMTALGLLFRAIKLFLMGRKSLYWSKIKGQVKQAQHISEIGPASRTCKFSHVMVVYEYDFQGETFSNDRVRYKWTRHRIGDELEKFKIGKEITVYVNPKNPVESVIEPGTDATNITATLCGILFAVGGVVLAIYR